eukprot:g1986.t2
MGRAASWASPATLARARARGGSPSPSLMRGLLSMPRFSPASCGCGSLERPLPGLLLKRQVVKKQEEVIRRSQRLLRRQNQAMRFGQLPHWAQRLARRCAPTPAFRVPYDQLIVNAYDPGEATMIFRQIRPSALPVKSGQECCLEQDTDRTVQVQLRPGDVYALRGAARYQWTHEISPVTQRRISRVPSMDVDDRGCWPLGLLGHSGLPHQTPHLRRQLLMRSRSPFRKLIKHKSTVGSLMSEQSKQFSSTPNVASMGWRAEQEKSTLIKAKDFEKGSVIFFANHTVTAQPGPNAVAKIVLLRVGDVSAEVSVELQSMDGTANAGRKYRALSCLGRRRGGGGQRVVFQPNVRIASCSVELIEHYAATRSFFVIHTHGIEGNATMGGCSFVRVRLLPTGAWPKGAHEDDVGQLVESDKVMHWRLVFAFSHELFRRRGWKLWHMILAMIWLTFHKVVLNTLLLNYALYDFCLTSTHLATAMGRLPFIALAKLLLVCCDRLADHIKGTSGGAGGATAYLQEVLTHGPDEKPRKTHPSFTSRHGRRSPRRCRCSGAKRFSVFTSDSQWVARYFGELTKVFGILFGGYATLETMKTGEGTMTLGRFTIFLSLYGIIIDAMYTFMKSWDGLMYASMLVSELATFVNEPDRFTPHLDAEGPVDETHPLMSPGRTRSGIWLRSWKNRRCHSVQRTLRNNIMQLQDAMTRIFSERLKRTGQFNIKLTSADFYLVNSPTARKTGSVHVPLGQIYGVKTHQDVSILRRRLCEVLGGIRTSNADQVLLGYARTGNEQIMLQVFVPVNLVNGRSAQLRSADKVGSRSVLENLLSNVAAWVRVSDVHALLALLGIPIPVPEGEEATHPSTAKMWRVLQEKADIKDDAEVMLGGFEHASMCHCGWFIERCQEGEFSMTSSADEAQEWLQPSELHLLDIARALLADPEILIIHDMLSIIPLPLARNAVQVLMLWQRLGGTLKIGRSNMAELPELGRVPGERDVEIRSSPRVGHVSSNRSGGSEESEDSQGVDVELQVQLRVAHLVARMELTRPEILRVTKAHRALQKLLVLYNGLGSIALALFVAFVLLVLFSLGLVPGFPRMVQAPELLFSAWTLGSGVTVTVLSFLLWRPQQRVFFDRMCISEHDSRLKMEAIVSLAGILKRSQEMLVLWDESWSDRLWCLFELAAFVKSRGSAQKLMIRPTFIGPCSIATFLTTAFAMVPLTTLPERIGGEGLIVTAAVGMLLFGGITMYFCAHAFRSYFRAVDDLKKKMQNISLDHCRSSCCDSDHQSEDGRSMMMIIKECVKIWFGSQEDFEYLVKTDVLDALLSELQRKSFTTTWSLCVATPLLWAFLDLGAAWTRHGDLDAGAAFWLNGLARDQISRLVDSRR